MTEFFSRLFAGEFSGRKLWTAESPLLKTRSNDPDDNRPKVGLALSSGAAKGLAHIGVIQVLEEHGIKIDAVAGSSMGAYVGAIWCAGNHGKKLEELAATIKTKWDAFQLLDPVIPPRRGFVKGHRVRERLLETLGDLSFEELERELLVITTELDNLNRVVFKSGSVVGAVCASIAIPGICEPVTIDGIDYTDGGVADPMPVNVLKSAGMDKVIAVCVMPTADELRYLREKTRNDSNRGWKSWINQHLNLWAEGNAFNIQRNAEFGMQMRLAELSMRDADVKIRPIVCDAKWHDYTGFEKYIRLGREVTESKIDQIKALVNPKPETILNEPKTHHSLGLS